MKKKSWALLVLVAFLLSANAVFAQGFSPVGAFEYIGVILESLFVNASVQSGAVIIFLFIILLAVITAASHAVPFFHNQARPRALFSVAFASLSTFGLYYAVGGGISNFVNSVLTSFGYVLAILLPLLLYIIVTRGFRDNLDEHQRMPLSILAGGMGLFLAGLLIKSAGLTGIGSLLMLVGLVWFIISLFQNQGHDAGHGGAHGNGHDAGHGGGDHGNNHGGANHAGQAAQVAQQHPQPQQPPYPNQLVQQMQQARGLFPALNQAFGMYQNALIHGVNAAAPNGNLNNAHLANIQNAVNHLNNIANQIGIILQGVAANAQVNQLNQNDQNLLAAINAALANYQFLFGLSVQEAGARWGAIDAAGMNVYQVQYP